MALLSEKAYSSHAMSWHKRALSHSVFCSTKTKYWIPVLETYWSIITSIAFQIILVQYQYSIEILNYFSVSLSVFQKKIKGPKFEHFIVLKRFLFRKCIVIKSFQVNCQISYQKCQTVYIIEQNIIYALKNSITLFWIAFQTKDLTHASLLWCFKWKATSNNSCQLLV